MSRAPDWLATAIAAAQADNHAHVYHSLGCRISGKHDPDCTPTRCDFYCECECDATPLNNAMDALLEAGKVMKEVHGE